MNWWAPLLTLLGTIVGASVTLAADRVRWRRDQDQRRHETLRTAYGGYLAALHATSEQIRAVSLGEHEPETPRTQAARAAFRSADLSAGREQLVLLAPARIVRAGDDAFRTLRELRDIVGEGAGLDAPDYQRVLGRYQAALRQLRDTMREDLGSPALTKDVAL